MLKKHIDWILEGKEVRFYQSKEWKHKRKQILKRDNYECQLCKQEGGFSVADCVHHKVHLKDNVHLGLVDDNLISLCNRHHNLEHPEKIIKAWGFYPSGEPKSKEDMKSLSEKLGNKERW